jgi:protease-4
MGDVAASGGYYIAAGCQKVVANPGTLTGSIGVITRLPYLGDIARSLKFDMVVIKSGKMKDAGDPFREMTNEENHYWQSLIDSIHQQFVSAVAEGRRLPIDEVKPFADGRILTGEAAKKLKLVDELGNFYDAVRLAATLARIEKEPRLQYPPDESPFQLEKFFRASGRAAVRGVKEEIFSSAGLPTKTLGPSYLMSFPNH